MFQTIQEERHLKHRLKFIIRNFQLLDNRSKIMMREREEKIKGLIVVKMYNDLSIFNSK